MIDSSEARQAFCVEYSDNLDIVAAEARVGQEPRDAVGIAMQHRPPIHCYVYQMNELRSEHDPRHRHEYDCQQAK